MYSIIVSTVVAFLASFGLTPVVRDLSRRFGLVDRPVERSVHRKPIPRVGGLAIALAYLIAFLFIYLSHLKTGDLVWSARLSIWRLLPAAVTIFAVGLYDDLRCLKPWQKLAGQVFAVVLAYAAGVHVLAFGGHTLAHWWSFPATLFWLLLCTNAVNLIDGVDGLAAGAGLFATSTMFVAALLQGNTELALATAPLAGALLAFLRFNFNPATIFLGDSGSLLIGFLLGCYGVTWSQKSATMLGMTAPVLALALPLLDASLAVARRFLRRKPIFTADLGHIHHRLLARGMTPRKVALVLYAFCAFGAVSSLAIMNQRHSGAIIVLFCLATWIGVQQLRYVEFEAVGRVMMTTTFRRRLNAQIALDNTKRRLLAATDPEDCWSAIEAAAAEFGISNLRMQMAGHSFERLGNCDPATCPTVRIPLLSADFIELTVTPEHMGHAFVLAPFIAILRQYAVRRTGDYRDLVHTTAGVSLATRLEFDPGPQPGRVVA